MVKKEKKIVKRKSPTKIGKETHEDVEICFCSPDAMSVCVAGEFNGWDTQSLPMKKDEGGVWRLKINLLPGRYEYKLFADNTWIESLPNIETVSNPFGTQNFVILVK